MVINSHCDRQDVGKWGPLGLTEPQGHGGGVKYPRSNWMEKDSKDPVAIYSHG